MSEVRKAVLIETRQLSPHVKELALQTSGETVAAIPGQWISLRLPIGDRPPLNRAYTLALPTALEQPFTLCFDRVENGIGSSYLWDAQVGTTFEFTGPVGNFVLPEGEGSLLLAAHYTGIVPFRAMLHHLATERSKRTIFLLYHSPSATEQVYIDELYSLQDRLPGLQILPQTADNSTDDTWGIETALHALSADFVPSAALVCGIREFTLPVRTLFMERFGLERKAVKVENYSGPAR